MIHLPGALGYPRFLSDWGRHMMEWLQGWLTTPGLMPHGYCLSWSPGLLWSMVGSDLVVGLSYYSIPIALVYFVRRHPELRFNFLLVMFSIFIFACGTTHFIDIVNIWIPVYRVDALLKIITAVVSVMTAAALWPLLPKISAFLRAHQETLASLKTSNRELEQFAGVVSHDLKAPIRSVSSFATLLERRYSKELGTQGQEYIELIRQSAKQMTLLVDDLLKLTQINADKSGRVTFGMSEAVATATSLLSSDIEAVGARIETGPLPKVCADQRLIVALFQNLISNAIKFQSPGTVPIIRIDAKLTGLSWRCSVKDNGIGIAAEHSGKIFQIFKRLHSAEEYAGTGIGLAMCKKIVELHGGEIGVESAPGQGSTFWFTLPALQDNDLSKL